MTVERLAINEDRVCDGPGTVTKMHAFGTLVRYDDYVRDVNALIRIAIGGYIEGLSAREVAEAIGSITGTSAPTTIDGLWEQSRTRARLHEIGKP